MLQKIYKCTIKTNSNTKLGHICYIDVTIYKAMSISNYLLSPHFPKVDILNVYFLSTDKFLSQNVRFRNIKQNYNFAEEKANRVYRHEQTYTSMNEKIFSKFKEAFKIYIKRSMGSICLCM